MSVAICLLLRRSFGHGGSVDSAETERGSSDRGLHHCRQSAVWRADSAFPEAQVRCLRIGTTGKASSAGIKPKPLTTVSLAAAALLLLHRGPGLNHEHPLVLPHVMHRWHEPLRTISAPQTLHAGASPS